MHQLAFDFSVRLTPSFDNFVVGCNGELVACLHELVHGERAEAFMYLWGAKGSGRTHLARAAIDALQGAGVPAAYHACASDIDPPAALHELDAVALDDVDAVSKDGEIALFNLYNALRERGGVMIATGPVAPSQLALRADVVSRLAWGLVYEVHALTDSEKARALAERAHARGFTLQADVSQYLLSHARRDMPALLATLDALDRYSLEAKRPVTVPLLRELLAGHGRNST